MWKGILSSIVRQSLHEQEENGNSDEDLESGFSRKARKSKRPTSSLMLHSLSNRLPYRYKTPLTTLFLAFFVLSLLLLFFIFTYSFLLNPPSYPAQDPPHYPYQTLHNLVMVAGHAVYTSNSCEQADGEASWFLESYQKHPGQATTFLDHIKAGIEATAMDDNALLLFSGGETRKDAGPRSEAQSYWIVAERTNWFGRKQDVRWRALTEEHARDSFENFLFSICRFRELTGKYPHNITVISYDFKEYRFANLHRLALRFPADRFFYKGTPPSPASASTAVKGEESVQQQFQLDPYGCTGVLHMKRWARDPFLRTVPYPSGCPEIKGLFDYCGTTQYSGGLPWD